MKIIKKPKKKVKIPPKKPVKLANAFFRGNSTT
jgi:hypothetical protein